MSARKFARWLRLVALWEHPPEVRFRFVTDVDDRQLTVILEYEGATAQVDVEAGTPILQAHADLDEFLGRLAAATARREQDRTRRRRAVYDETPAPN